MSRCGGPRCRSAQTTADPPDPPNSQGRPRRQQHLDSRLAGRTPPPCRNGDRSSPRPDAQHASTPFLPVLAERLAAISRSGINAAQLLNTAINAGPLPDEHGAAALWWRISRHLHPAVTAAAARSNLPLTAGWADQLADVVGADLADRLRHSPSWPALVSAVDHALQRGWPLDQLLADNGPTPPMTSANRWCGGFRSSPTPPPTRPTATGDPQADMSANRPPHHGEPIVNIDTPVRHPRRRRHRPSRARARASRPRPSSRPGRRGSLG